MISRAEYEAAICKQLPHAKNVRFKKVALDDWAPEVGKCHDNVKKWVETIPGQKPVIGWVAYMDCLLPDLSIGRQLTTHSVVLNDKGELYDITPLADERQRPFLRFVPHFGDDEVFWDFEKNNRCMCCPNCSQAK